MKSIKFPLKYWGPWENNPSASKNFYDTNESFEEKNSESLNEEIINEIINKTSDKSKIVDENISSVEKDPYAAILKDLK